MGMFTLTACPRVAASRNRANVVEGKKFATETRWLSNALEAGHANGPKRVAFATAFDLSFRIATLEQTATINTMIEQKNCENMNR